jgi:hypothetical protein
MTTLASIWFEEDDPGPAVLGVASRALEAGESMLEELSEVLRRGRVLTTRRSLGGE